MLTNLSLVVPTQTRARRVRARSITSEVKFLVNFAAQRGGPRSSPPINATSSQPLPAPGHSGRQCGRADETQASSQVQVLIRPQVQVLIRPELDAGGDSLEGSDGPNSGPFKVWGSVL